MFTPFPKSQKSSLYFSRSESPQGRNILEKNRQHVLGGIISEREAREVSFQWEGKASLGMGLKMVVCCQTEGWGGRNP